MVPYLFCYSSVPPTAVGLSWISRRYVRHSVSGLGFLPLEPANQVFSQIEGLLLRCMFIGKKRCTDADTSRLLQNFPLFLFKSSIDLAWVQCVL